MSADVEGYFREIRENRSSNYELVFHGPRGQLDSNALKALELLIRSEELIQKGPDSKRHENFNTLLTLARDLLLERHWGKLADLKELHQGLEGAGEPTPLTTAELHARLEIATTGSSEIESPSSDAGSGDYADGTGNSGFTEEQGRGEDRPVANTAPQKIVLALSGGGLRATLFHLGVVRYLFDMGLLSRVAQLTSVSGGSILAAHIVQNWKLYTGDRQAFDKAAKQLVDFCRRDVRGRAVRRWPLNRTRLLAREYEFLFKKKNLGTLDREGAPKLHLLTTDLTSARLVSFSPQGITLGLGESSRLVASTRLRVSLAVAASSAFPPVFPPIRLTHRDLGLSLADFGTPVSLTDGGVYDNLGVRKAKQLRGESPDSCLVVSNAGSPFQWEERKSYTTLRYATRVAFILMERVEDIAYKESKREAGTNQGTLFLNMADSNADSLLYGSPVEELQREIAKIRTDLNSFTDDEVRWLTTHGYTVAHRNLGRAWGLGKPDVAWSALGNLKSQTTAQEEVEGDIEAVRESRSPPLGLFSLRDPIWIVHLLVVLVGGLGIAFGAYRFFSACKSSDNRRSASTEEKAAQMVGRDTTVEHGSVLFVDYGAVISEGQDVTLTRRKEIERSLLAHKISGTRPFAAVFESPEQALRSAVDLYNDLVNSVEPGGFTRLRLGLGSGSFVLNEAGMSGEGVSQGQEAATHRLLDAYGLMHGVFLSRSMFRDLPEQLREKFGVAELKTENAGSSIYRVSTNMQDSDTGTLLIVNEIKDREFLGVICITALSGKPLRPMNAQMVQHSINLFMTEKLHPLFSKYNSHEAYFSGLVGYLAFPGPREALEAVVTLHKELDNLNADELGMAMNLGVSCGVGQVVIANNEFVGLCLEEVRQLSQESEHWPDEVVVTKEFVSALPDSLEDLEEIRRGDFVIYKFAPR